MLKAINIVKCYGHQKVLHNIHLKVRAGEMLGILGPNGSGKSTFLRILAGIEQPDDGEIWLDDVRLTQFSPKERAQQIAVVPQEGAEASLSITVEEYILMGREPYQRWWPWYVDEDRRLVAQWMRELDLDCSQDRPLSALSGGERQRTEIARAMVQEPQYVMLDEPTNHLDLRYQLATLSMLKRLKEEKGIAVIIVMHDVNLAAQYCDHLLFLRSGRRIGYGKPEQIINQELIREVYGVDVLIIKHPRMSIPQVLCQ